MTVPEPAGEAPHRDPSTFDECVESAGPDSCLVVIAGWMGPGVRAWCQPEDVWQETLICAWRDRGRHEWTSSRDYRSWLLAIARNRVADAARRASAKKRGGDAALGGLGDPGAAMASAMAGSALDRLPAGSGTPSRAASRRERVAMMLRALESLPPEFEAVVRLHLFEEKPLEQVAEELGIGAAAVRYRLRRGTQMYAGRLDALRSNSAGSAA